MCLRLVLTMMVFVICSCQEKQSERIQKTKVNAIKKTEPKNTIVQDNFTVKTIFSPDVGWGYQILNNDKLYINQPHIPAVAGIKGFSDENKAQITADFMIYKLNNGIFPPTISVEELDSLGVLNDD